MDKIIKLSDAIRLGATFRGQCFGVFYENKKSCVIGAAMEALGLREHQYEYLEERFPIMHKMVKPPDELRISRGVLFPLASVLWRLNDRLRWTREKIADWVEEQEKSCPV